MNKYYLFNLIKTSFIVKEDESGNRNYFAIDTYDYSVVARDKMKYGGKMDAVKITEERALAIKKEWDDGMILEKIL